MKTTIETIQMGVPIARCELLDALTVKAVNARNRLGLPEQPMLLFEFHGSPAGVAWCGRPIKAAMPSRTIACSNASQTRRCSS